MLNILQSVYSTCVQKVNYPVHQGKPNPAHGKFFFVGCIPLGCYDPLRNSGIGGSKLYETEQMAISAAIAAGATRIQNVNCQFVDISKF